MPTNFLIFRFLLVLFWVSTAVSLPRIPSLLYIPTADMLPHGQFHLYSYVNYFQSSTLKNDTLTDDLTNQTPYSVGVVFGLFDRAQCGFQFGNELSFSWKSYVMESRGKLYIPDISVGVRSMFSSQEARLYGVTRQDEKDWLKNEAYIALSGNLTEGTRLHLGSSVTSTASNGQGSFFFGIEQFLGKRFYANYETFERFDSYRHHLTFLYKFKTFLAFSFGFSELQSWLFQKGTFGFFMVPERRTSEGYGSPGFRAAISMGGFTSHQDKKQRLSRIEELEQQHSRVSKELGKLKDELAGSQKRITLLESGKDDTWEIEKGRIVELLDLLKAKLNSELPYQPSEIILLQDKILDLKGNSVQVLISIVTNPSTDVAHRAIACMIMGKSNMAVFTEALLKATADPEPGVRREAILALGRMKLRVALKDAEKLLNDIDDTVVLAAREAIKRILDGGKPEEMEKYNFGDVP